MSYVGELVGLRISARILDTGKNTAELYRFKTKNVYNEKLQIP